MPSRILAQLLTCTICLCASTLIAADDFTLRRELVRVADVELATDVYLPAEVPAPVILARTPYGTAQLAFLAEFLVGHGYVVVIQDVRGRYGSSGEHEPFRHERVDGLATLDWIQPQDWCDGRVGMWGSSYSGYAALVVADADRSAFRSILSISGWLDAKQIIRPGGANHLMLNLPWMLTQQGRTQRGLGEFNIQELFRHVPLRDAMRAAGIRNSTWEDPSWMTVLEEQKIGVVPRPVFHLTGWHDMVYQATLTAWQDMAATSPTLQKLAIGPWYHNQFLFGDWQVGDAQFGEASGFGIDEMLALSLRWFDATLKGENNGILDEPPVSYFLMEQNTWHHHNRWPPVPEDVDVQRWYLDSGGHANSASGDGTLKRGAPTGAASDSFEYDPNDPVPTLGGANFFYFPNLVGVRDQREIELRNDVLVYTSAPLAREIHITGPIRVALQVGTSAPQTDFTAKLVIVRPDGYARIVEDGVSRVGPEARQAGQAGTARGASPDASLTDAPFQVNIDVGHTALKVPVGHRLRLEISSSNFPKYDRNPNTEEDPFLATQFETARQRVFHDARHPSYVQIPVQRTRLDASPRAREPLVRPVATAAAATAPVVGDDANVLVAQARAELDSEEIDQAIETMQKAVELQSDGSLEHLWLGRAYLAKLQKASMFKKLGLSKKVLASFRRAVELDPDHIEARTSLASFYFEAPGIAGGDFDKGLAQVAEIRKRDAYAAHLLLGGRYSQRNQYAEAQREFRFAIQAQPDSADAYYALGVACQRAEDWEHAYEAFEAGFARGEDLRCLYQIGRTGALSGHRADDAKQAMESYIARAPESNRLPSVAAAYWRLGMIYERMERRDLARLQYEKALEVDPELEQAKEALKAL